MLSFQVRYGTPLHDRIKQAICERKKFSEQKMKQFHSQWDNADDSMRAYIKEREVDRKRKDKKRFDGEVDYVTLEVPYAYAMCMTQHTYFTSTLLGRSPIFQFTGRHGEAQDSIMAVEAVVDYQVKSGYMVPVMYNWLYDLSKYSLGVVGLYWDQEEKVISKYQAQPTVINGIPFAGSNPVLQQEIIKGYEGNRLYNIRPYDWYPDPRVPIWRFQDGEFNIRETTEGYFDIIATEHSYPGYYCNVDKLPEAASKKGTPLNIGSPRVERPLQPGEGNAPGPGFFKITEAYIKLIPKVWGLGDSGRVEIWCFQLAEDEIIISAKPLGLYHNRFPCAAMEGNFGSDEFAKFGTIEVIRPLTDILTWLINSHFYNVRRVLNNQIVFDPSRVTVKDLTKSGQRLIRLKPAAYGTDPRMAVHQLTMVDVTGSHLQNAQYIEQMIQRVPGITDILMGMVDQGGRRSATESRITSTAGISRQKTPIEYNSYLAMDPLADMIISNTQQLLSEERKYAVAGNTLEAAQNFLTAGPDQIAGSYNFVPVDGAAPIDRLAQANFWKELLVQVARVPQIAMQLDLVGMIGHVMKLQGERNFERFRINVLPPGVAPGAAVPGQGGLPAQPAGNVVPLGAPSAPRSRQSSGQGGHPKGTSGGTV
jgi:hypothetical protein